MIILFIYFEIHSCSEDRSAAPRPPDPLPSLLCNATDVFFIDSDNGWIVGQMGTLVLTTDGGVTWESVKVDGIDIRSITFLDRQNGWIVGKDGKIFKSEDGGLTWNQRLFGGYPQDDDFYDIEFRGEGLGFILGYHGVFVSEDGGDDWENYWLPIVYNRGAWNMSILDENIGFLLGSKWTDADPELLYKTTDGGKHWTSVPGSNASILRTVLTIGFVDEDTGWAGGGVIMKTADGGVTWTCQSEEATVRQFGFIDARYGFAAGGRAILRTVDGGENWIDVCPDDEKIVDLRSMCFIDGQSGWVVGRGREEERDGRIYSYSVILSTEDGGDSWSIDELPYDMTDIVLSEIYGLE